MKKLNILTFLLLSIFSIIFSQFREKTTLIYEDAHQLAFSGNEDSALVICDLLLMQNEENIDALVLKARILGWKGKYNTARELLLTGSNKDKPAYDFLDALSDIEYWDSKYQTALSVIERALELFPDDSLFLAKEKFISGLIKNDEQDTIVAHRCMKISYYFDFFNEMYKRRWHVFSVASPFNVTSKLTLSPQVNIGYLSPVSKSNEKFALQVESDMYYIAGKKYYLYANLGFSGSPLFPGIKTGLEYFFTGIPKLEFSTGFRYMRWNHDIYFGTFSVARYYKSYLFIFRPYFSLRDFNTSSAYMFTARKYFQDTDYAGISFIFGASPDQSYDLFLEHGAYKSQKVILNGSKQLDGRKKLILAVSYSNEEYRLHQYQNRFDFLVGIDFCF